VNVFTAMPRRFPIFPLCFADLVVSFRQTCVTERVGVDTVELCLRERPA
jgi:hypothetical protein